MMIITVTIMMTTMMIKAMMTKLYNVKKVRRQHAADLM